MGPEDDNFENTGCQQAERDPESQVTDFPLSEAESRRFAALDQAIRVYGTSVDDGPIVKMARAFETYLKGE